MSTGRLLRNIRVCEECGAPASLRHLPMCSRRNMRRIVGSDIALDYEFLRDPDHPPVVLSIIPPKRRDGKQMKWDERASQFIGEQVGIHWPPQPVGQPAKVQFVRIIAVQINELTERLELTCR